MKMLLHACCAPCSAQVVKELQRDFTVTIFYFNDNIWPETEYEKRLAEVKRYYQKISVPLVVEPYNHQQWLNLVSGLESEPERGSRCQICYQTRLALTGAKAQVLGFDYFATAMSISPFKDVVLINQAGQKLAKNLMVKFFAADFKQNNGYQKSLVLSKQEGFYRQRYCGCEFSATRTPKPPKNK
ncbi:MAG: epoxyqueuosine reductase QueH [Candidatus Buchananbacteria bacterium]